MTRYRSLSLGALSIVLVLLAACSNSSSSKQANATATATTGTKSSGFTFTTSGIPRFEQAPNCTYALDPSVSPTDLICGNLVTLEDRSKPNGNLVKLAVVIFKSHSANVQPDPVIYLAGGPGGSAIEGTAQYTVSKRNYNTVVGNRAFIFIDQRGTGYSTPSLQCQEIIDDNIAQLPLNLTIQQSLDESNAAAKKCRDRLASSGIDLNMYNTHENANDISDLITAIGVKQANVYGVSYGTRLAQEVMRSFPKGVRTITLDSTFPVQVNSYTQDAKSFANIFNKLFDACSKDTTCNGKYPNLQQTLATVYSQLNTTPATFKIVNPFTGDGKQYDVSFNGDSLVNLMFQVAYVTDAIPYLPSYVTDAQTGNWSNPANPVFNIARLEGFFTFDTSVSYGLYSTTSCHDDAPFTKPEDVDAAGQALPAFMRDDLVASFKGELAGCGSVWNVKGADPAFKQPVTSDIPTLVMKDEFDPITPPINGELAASTLKNSFQVLFPGLGHGASYQGVNCPDQVLHAFYDKPTTKPDSSCTASMGEPQWK